MINEIFIVRYLRSLNPNSAKAMSARFGIFFTDEEIALFLPYLQERASMLLSLREPSKKIHADLDDKICVDSVDKFCFLLSKLGYR